MGARRRTMTVRELKKALEVCSDDDVVIVVVEGDTCNVEGVSAGGPDSFNGATEIVLG